MKSSGTAPGPKGTCVFVGIEKMNAVNEEIIQQMTDRIVERFAPEKIILFGSHARGDATEDSDVDLLIIMPFQCRPRDLRVKIRMLLADLPVAKDIIVLKPHEYEQTKDLPGSIAYPAKHEGVVLYAA